MQTGIVKRRLIYMEKDREEKFISQIDEYEKYLKALRELAGHLPQIIFKDKNGDNEVIYPREVCFYVTLYAIMVLERKINDIKHLLGKD